MAIASQKTKRPGYKQTEVGVIPEDWNAELMDSVAKRGSGHTPDKQHPEYWDGDIKWISLKDSDRLDELYICDTAATITPAGIANSSAIMHAAGTVVLSRDAGVGKSAIMRDAMAVSQHFMAWLCGPRLDNHFLYYWLQSKKSEFERIAFGNTIKTIGLPYFKKLKIPLPPLHEQQMVAAALNAVGALISGLDQLIAKKRDIKTAAMQQLLTGKRRLPGFGRAKAGFKVKEIGAIPEEWEVKALGELGQFKNGINKDKEDFGHGFPFVNLLDVFGIPKVSSDIDFGLVNSSTAERKLYELRKGDVLFVRSSVKPDGVGLSTLVQEDLPDTVFSGFLIRYRDSGQLALEYKEHCFGETGFRGKLIAISTISANTNINQNALKGLQLAFPTDKREQKAIAAVLSDMDAYIAALESRRDKTRAIKQGMMQQLLTGKIRLV